MPIPYQKEFNCLPPDLKIYMCHLSFAHDLPLLTSSWQLLVFGLPPQNKEKSGTMVFTTQPHQLVGFSLQSQQQGCGAACLQTLVSFPLQSLTPTFREFAMTGLTPVWGQGKSCPSQTEPSDRHIPPFQHAEKGEDPTPATGVHVSPSQDDPSFLTSHDTATHIRNIHTAVLGLSKTAVLLSQMTGWQ